MAVLLILAVVSSWHPPGCISTPLSVTISSQLIVDHPSPVPVRRILGPGVPVRAGLSSQGCSAADG